MDLVVFLLFAAIWKCCIWFIWLLFSYNSSVLGRSDIQYYTNIRVIVFVVMWRADRIQSESIFLIFTLKSHFVFYSIFFKYVLFINTRSFCCFNASAHILFIYFLIFIYFLTLIFIKLFRQNIACDMTKNAYANLSMLHDAALPFSLFMKWYDNKHKFWKTAYVGWNNILVLNAHLV